MRQVVLDTETTGLSYRDGHRIIEIGCVEIVDRRITKNIYHTYINPNRMVDPGAAKIHGITDRFLSDKPLFSEIAEEFVEFIIDAELIAHNASFDMGFIEHELSLLGLYPKVSDMCSVVDTLLMARRLHPKKKNNLDALCERYKIDNSHRDLHGALLDAEILADLYLLMTCTQSELNMAGDDSGERADLSAYAGKLKVVKASADELEKHDKRLDIVEESSGGKCIWRDANR